ncbi:protein-glutamate methylesterase/protein-glutamine glutaminase [Oceanobacillus saliphilus]|uniref:protein-glutamate methylesterase/protein-glutamine glutaminase n=1 Tax=Oceanobacillus saliphilus TaxID=2925834 RepID=UPI00201DFE8E|nr:chemotaxis response regulator protein-glutamate methylesterase [Oceanobacillus saliphilus]
MQPIRALVIDDSAFMRKVISDILNNDSRIEVIGTARNGEEGIKKARELAPDVITMDIHMPIMDGMDALQEIMKDNPTPVVILSSVTQEGTAKTIQAISNGAIDFITKPSGSISLDIQTIEDEITSKVFTASQVNMNKNKKIKKLSAKKPHSILESSYDKTVVTIGTSTGGPRALQHVLTKLPASFSAPILIVQHMPKGFTKSLANRLNTLSHLHVKEAIHGEMLEKGTAYIAPGDYHMTVKKVGKSMAIHLTDDAPIKGHRPAVDVLLDSLATVKQVNKIAVILTGMGSDGSKGLIKMKETDSKSTVIAESEETSIVYGMPKSAVHTGYVDYQLPIHEIAELLVKLMK